MINVTKPFLPPKADYIKMVDEIYERAWLTNNGPFVNELELRLKQYLGVDHLLYMSNGTITLQIAIKALELKGDIITTPFSYVATTSSIIWENCKPVFVDVVENTMNIDPAKIEAAITLQTTGILATHVYGNPCEIDQIQSVADMHGLKIIYDAAHCFGTYYKGQSVFNYGDVSSVSFHATKLFHTIEGGAVISTDPELIKLMSRMRNFGHDGPDSFYCVGINGKNSEFHAAMGLINLDYCDAVLSRRKEQYLTYMERLKNLHVQFLSVHPAATFNYAYFPVIFPDEEKLQKAVKALNDQYVYPRRYFYPSLSQLNYIPGKINPTPIADSLSKRVICLPMYHELSTSSIDMISRVLLRAQKY